MREILFRGKRTDNDEWAFGFFTKSPSGNVYITETVTGCASPKTVDPDTVGQFTDLTDKNGKKIFEGDIIKAHTGRILTVAFGQHTDEEYGVEAYGWFVFDNEGALSFGKDWGGHEVIGNIHDNPEPLGGAEDGK